MKTVHFVFMGVAGCGKTTAAVDLQKHLDCPYAEGDDFHTQTNRDKMGAGIPLTDEDRYPWLGNLRDWMSEQARAGERRSSGLFFGESSSGSRGDAAPPAGQGR